ncbi:carotenoid biosynthesis protein [Halorhabdus sp. SVX81]|uniref:carotenoid biosynthesis protein n=1 Tax=Halorhabdus sp. SVX81 TaxID=2978283 RepID=UPI0023DAF6BB|nr:carotenoid biosynthesis protein [Halorhabdus sp. SVX81]
MSREIVFDRDSLAVMTLVVGLVGLSHAGFTWPHAATIALFGGGAIVAFVAEAIVINRGLLHHHIDPKLVGVPVYVLLGWTGVVYIAFRVALLWTNGWLAVGTGAVLATGYDALVDHRGVIAGAWTYTDDLPGPRFRGVPWWNYVGWFVISSVTAALALPFL